MTTLHPLSEFIQNSHQSATPTPKDGSHAELGDRPALDPSQAAYWYAGRCPHTGEWVALPRTPLAEAIAHSLMDQLANSPDLSRELSHEGKMFGVLLVETLAGEKAVLKAFSGLLQGQQNHPGWVPPIPGREQVVEDETRTLEALDAIKQQLIDLQHHPERQELARLTRQFEQQWTALGDRHRQGKHRRQQQRQHLQASYAAGTLTQQAWEQAIAALDDESRRDGIERRNFKRKRETILQPLRQRVDEGDRQIHQLKARRKELSRTLQTQLHNAYRLTNFRGLSSPLPALMPDGTMPTGTGDCCAPKLLHNAATHHLTPLAMAEFWWGAPSPQGDRQPGHFYGACAERCQPLMGFLLSGLDNSVAIAPAPPTPRLHPIPCSILYEDDWLIAIDKPAGLLSVPGRYRHTQDSALSRLRLTRPDLDTLAAVHRLDQDTSGILLIAKDADTYVCISQQFQQRTVKKIYGAVLDGVLSLDQGVIDLPLSPVVGDRPRQQVDLESGKPSTTLFHVTARQHGRTRVQFTPLTGRTHQLRVHAADPRGLGIPILGDRLYGTTPNRTRQKIGQETKQEMGQEKGDRLHLHASELTLTHPTHNHPLHLKTPIPF